MSMLSRGCVAAVALEGWGYRRVDNITAEILDLYLDLYRKAVGETVTKDDIFYYVYGVLHDPDYRTNYAADLKRMLPHITTPQSADRFTAVRDIGRKPADLHLNYETAKPYSLDVVIRPGADPKTGKRGASIRCAGALRPTETPSFTTAR
jgi:predicted helicase